MTYSLQLRFNTPTTSQSTVLTREWECYHCAVRWHGLRQLFVAALLTLCVGVYVVEFSGHWDHTIQDANDEAGIVGVVLCIGVTLFIAGTHLNRIRASRLASQIVVPDSTLLHDTVRVALPSSINSPPGSQRI
jgi:hypothetical protein